jgi:ferredoxin
MSGYISWDELVKAFWGKVPLEKEIPANILAGTTVGLRRREIPPDAKKVRVTIDGQTIEVPEGTLIIEAAKMLGIDIPHFCYHPRLEPVGVCRQCLVEVGMPRRNPDGTIATDEQGNPIIQWMPKPQPFLHDDRQRWHGGEGQERSSGSSAASRHGVPAHQPPA